MKKIINALIMFFLGVFFVLILLFSAYLGATDECKARGSAMAAIGRYGIYCITYEPVKTVDF